MENWAERRKPEYAETYLNLGNFQFLKGDIKKAEEYYKKAIELKPDYVAALKNLAVLYSNTNRQNLAAETWKKIRFYSPNDPDVLKIFPQKPS